MTKIIFLMILCNCNNLHKSSCTILRTNFNLKWNVFDADINTRIKRIKISENQRLKIRLISVQNKICRWRYYTRI
jgi:hypothetical protein